MVAVVVAGAHADDIKLIKSWHDVQLYLKPKYDAVRTFDQEFGIQATLAKYGNLTEQVNACYDPTYPVRFGSKPRFSIGEQTNYIFLPNKYKPAFYTKFKNNLIGTWKEETGITGKLLTSQRVCVSANFAWLYTLPFKSTAKPQWLALVNINFPLG